MWKIRVHYITGNSFGSNNTYETFDRFINKAEAELAKEYILDHYDFYKRHDKARKDKERQEIEHEIAKRPWFVYSSAYPNSRKQQLQYFYWSIAMKCSDTWITQSIGWTGYFESLVEVEVYRNDDELDWSTWSDYEHDNEDY